MKLEERVDIVYPSREANENAPAAIRMVYVAGTGFCGSTLLSILVNTHPEVLGIGEMGAAAPYEVPGYRCSREAEVT